MLLLRVRQWALGKDTTCTWSFHNILPTCTMLALVESIRISSMENTRHTSKLTICLRLKSQCQEQIRYKLVRISKDLQSPVLQSRTPTGCRAPRRTHPGLTDSEIINPPPSRVRRFQGQRLLVRLISRLRPAALLPSVFQI